MTLQRRLFRDTRKETEEAVQHVLRGWFPVSRQVLDRIKLRAAEGDYSKHPRALFEDLKQDQALFTLCLRQLEILVPEDLRGESPAQILSSLEQEKLTRLLAIPDSALSTHSIDPNSKPHSMRIRHSVISASTVEALAEGAHIDTGKAFLCASVRQLGLNLVAWNYPRIFAKALATVSKGTDTLEEALFKVLGYSPLQLGIRAAVGWSEAPEIALALGAETEADASTVGSSPSAVVIKRFCEVGELVAQANDPEHFPSAAARWSSVVRELTDQLGPNALELVQAKIEANGEAYFAASNGAFKADLTGERNVKVALTQLGTRLLEQNTYATKCPATLQEKFRSVYQAVIPGQASPTAVKFLVDEVIPALGFMRGCVYLVDHRKAQAVPMLRIGDVALDRFKALNCSQSGAQAHPVIEALSYSAPIVQENAFVHGDRVSHVTGTFGGREKTGVLYLEMTRELSGMDRQLALTYFKAVKQALNDCLNMPDR